MKELKDYVAEEVFTLNRMFRQNKVMAKVVKAKNVLDSYIVYELKLAPNQSFSAIERLQKELTAQVNRCREKNSFPLTDLVLVDHPFFAIQASHPEPKELKFNYEKIVCNPHEMILGKNALNELEVLKFANSPHALIAGITDSGKSILLQQMILSLVMNTLASELELYLIDLKNEDLIPFKSLPHVKRFATNLSQAKECIAELVEVKNSRDGPQTKSKRIVLVIDELAQIVTGNKSIMTSLSDLISTGRSKRINIIAATQLVTSSGGVGSMMKANFGTRLVGKVAPGMSQIATGLPKQYAHLLPGRGSFLRIEGSTNKRIQSFNLNRSTLAVIITAIIRVSRETNGAENKPFKTVFKPALERFKPVKTALKPVEMASQPELERFKTNRELTREEALYTQKLLANGMSKTTICKKIFGSKNQKTWQLLLKALEVK